MRCFGDGNAQYEAYHDEEWGLPVTDERGLYERLCLEGLQSGLSWALILKRREGLRDAFHGFHPDAVARFGSDDVDRLMQDVRVIRHRRKLEAIVTNARATVALRETEALPELIWRHRPGPRPAPRTWADVPVPPEAKALAKELKRHGFAFVGPTTMYALMQAVGLVNDHLAACPVRERFERAQFELAQFELAQAVHGSRPPRPARP